MRKIQIVGTALFAVLAFAVVSVASASATLWLKNGESIKETLAANSHGEIILQHEKGTFGKNTIKCSGLFVGLVFVSGKDEVTLIEDLTSTHTDLIECTSTNSLCPKPIVHADNLHWLTILLLEGQLTFDDFTGKPGYVVLCPFGVEILCAGPVKAHFDENLANGALFLWLKASTLAEKCSDEGEAWLEGMGEVLGFNVS